MGDFFGGFVGVGDTFEVFVSGGGFWLVWCHKLLSVLGVWSIVFWLRLSHQRLSELGVWFSFFWFDDFIPRPVSCEIERLPSYSCRLLLV